MKRRIEKLESATAQRPNELIAAWSATMADFTDDELDQIADSRASPELLVRFELATVGSDVILDRWIKSGGDVVEVFGNEIANFLLAEMEKR